MLHKWKGKLKKYLCFVFAFLLLFLTAVRAVPAKAAAAKSYSFDNQKKQE